MWQQGFMSPIQGSVLMGDSHSQGLHPVRYYVAPSGLAGHMIDAQRLSPYQPGGLYKE